MIHSHFHSALCDRIYKHVLLHKTAADQFKGLKNEDNALHTSDSSHHVRPCIRDCRLFVLNFTAISFNIGENHLQQEMARMTTYRSRRLPICHLTKSWEQASQTSRSCFQPWARFRTIFSLNRKLHKVSNRGLCDRRAFFHESPHARVTDFGFEQDRVSLTQTSHPYFWEKIPWQGIERFDFAVQLMQRTSLDDH